MENNSGNPPLEHGIPSNISREHILLALKKLDKDKWESENNSIKYDLVHDGKRYPPKMVVYHANEFINGKPFEVSEFSGGEDTTNKFFTNRNFDIDYKPKTSLRLIIDKVYSRDDLKQLFDITAASINNGIFKPRYFSSVWLFVTEEKTPDRTQYKDYFDGESLLFEGQTERRTDHYLIDHETDGNEILVFYRKKRDEYPNFGFRYLGPFSYVSHTTDTARPGPTRFVLCPTDIFSPPADSIGNAAENQASYKSDVEGKERERIQTYYERRPHLRRQAIRFHGTTCKVCGFNFEKRYGHLGEGYIEIHHIVPHSAIKSEREIDPTKDLIPVCSNCHRMIHRFKDSWLTIEQLGQLLQ